MRKLCLILLLFSLLKFPVMAQDTDARLLFARFGNGATPGIYLLNANTGEEQLITDSFADAGWSPDGRVWVVDTVAGERRLRFFDAESRKESTFGERLYLDSCFSSLLWSPDGEQLAYFTGKKKDERVLKMLNQVDGSSYQMPATQNEMPQWSPDGNYVLINAPLVSSPFRLLAAGDGRELLSTVENAVFSPDSRYLAYEDEENAIWLYEPATGEKIKLKVPESYPIWSPSGSYLVYLSAENLYYYAVGSGSLHSIDIGYPIKFAGWTKDESSILLYADFVDYSGDGRATTVLRYDLATRQSETVLEDTAWIGGVYRSGDWLAIRYSLVPLEDRYAPTRNLLIYNGKQRIEAELLVGDGWLRPSIASLADERGFLIAARDGLYRFDSQSASLEAIHLGSTSYPYWTVAGDRLAFVTFLSMNQQGFYHNLNIWNAESETKRVLSEEKNQVEIIGWQGSRQRNSLLYCGVG